MRSFEKLDEDNIEEWLQGDVCELGFQHMTDTTLLMLPQNKSEKKRIGRNHSKVVNASVIAWHYNVLTLLDYMGQRAFEYSNITATREILCHEEESKHLGKQATITHYFSK
jgi:hypothetical protein